MADEPFTTGVTHVDCGFFNIKFLNIISVQNFKENIELVANKTGHLHWNRSALESLSCLLNMGT